jgi:hypothetical protein
LMITSWQPFWIYHAKTNLWYYFNIIILNIFCYHHDNKTTSCTMLNNYILTRFGDFVTLTIISNITFIFELMLVSLFLKHYHDIAYNLQNEAYGNICFLCEYKKYFKCNFHISYNIISNNVPMQVQCDW